MELLLLIACMLLAGVAAGFLAGLLGVGGGIVVVPAVFFALGIVDLAPDMRMQIAVGSSLATIIFTGTVSARAHYQKGNLNSAVLKAWVVPIFIGVAVGTLVAARASSTALALVFGSVALIVALWLIFGGVKEDTNATLNTRSPFFLGYGGFVGFLSTLMGIGGGTISVPMLTFLGERVHRAVGTSAAIGVGIGVFGTIGFIIAGWGKAGLPPFSLGFVNLLAVAAVIPTSMLLAPVGAKVVSILKPQTVKYLFATFLVLVAFNMLREAFFG